MTLSSQSMRDDDVCIWVLDIDDEHHKTPWSKFDHEDFDKWPKTMLKNIGIGEIELLGEEEIVDAIKSINRGFSTA